MARGGRVGVDWSNPPLTRYQVNPLPSGAGVRACGAGDREMHGRTLATVGSCMKDVFFLMINVIINLQNHEFDGEFLRAGVRRRRVVVVMFIHNIPVRFVNQLKLNGLSRSHPVRMATAAVVTDQQRKRNTAR